ncbi:MULTISPECIES: hypothetical protein [unclassified Ruminococcus]|uniref:hypothetical protein n=1 Tax=unclassified Ruminococcus TaxID=2608920 RepID=UPI00210B9FAC|nr:MULTISPECIES: hypothetical protein [unclassified Ruminococcus]MCQ4022453.1 hypothetical protein [Ruminococcus sp. zg-924]MCQ4115717.1 hypothetical protein [Ruminococcus sp. zg-921]
MSGKFMLTPNDGNKAEEKNENKKKAEFDKAKFELISAVAIMFFAGGAYIFFAYLIVRILFEDLDENSATGFVRFVIIAVITIVGILGLFGTVTGVTGSYREYREKRSAYFNSASNSDETAAKISSNMFIKILIIGVAITLIFVVFISIYSNKLDTIHQEKEHADSTVSNILKSHSNSSTSSYYQYHSSSKSSSSYKPNKSSKSSSGDDPFNAKDYCDPDDFYHDYYDDFYDYEDAEDYYYEHQ